MIWKVKIRKEVSEHQPNKEPDTMTISPETIANSMRNGLKMGDIIYFPLDLLPLEVQKRYPKGAWGRWNGNNKEISFTKKHPNQDILEW